MDNIVNHIDGANGIIVDYDYFIKIVKTIFFFSKTRVDPVKKHFIKKRREMLEKNMMDHYEGIHN